MSELPVTHDPVTAEVIRNALIVAAEEGSVVVVRSSHSTWIQEGADAAAAIMAADGRLVAQSAATTLMHGASLRCGLLALLAEIAVDEMADGDVFALNDPYRGGIHANDIMVFRPVFADGEVAYVAGTVIHVADVGGSNAGGLASLATDTFAEGILLPPVRLFRAGERVDDMFAVLARNSRLPAKTLGDVGALIAGATVVGRRVQTLLDRYGAALLGEHVDAYLDYCERRVRTELAALPRDARRGEFLIDTDGIDHDREYVVRVEVETSVDGGIRIDFTGTSPQAAGPINASYSQALSGVVYAVRTLIDPTIPMNEGSFAPIDAVLPAGSLLNPDQPAACGGRIVSVTGAVDAVLDAVGQVLPERAVAPSSLIQVFALSGRRPGGDNWVHMSYEFGGIGARSTSDGPNATGCYFLGGRSVVPQIEPVEAAYPLRVEGVQLIEDSGGAGRRRGGLGVEMRLHLLEDANLTVRGDRIVFPPPGRGGGGAGGAGGFAVERPDGTVEQLATRQSNVAIRGGETFVMRTSGGGGLGDPTERERDLVIADVDDGLVSDDAAHDVYGRQGSDS